MPTPNKNESRKDFLSRCMGSKEMESEFSNVKQRYAVCVSKWQEHIKSTAEKISKKLSQSKTNK